MRNNFQPPSGGFFCVKIPSWCRPHCGGTFGSQSGFCFYAAMYKGEVIEEFTKAQLSKFYKKWGKLTGKELAEALENLNYYNKEYPVNTLKPLVKASSVYMEFGSKGQKLIRTVDNEVESILIKFTKNEINEKVMVSGMVYKNSLQNEVFTATNFLKEEIDKGKGVVLQRFIEEMHPTLKKRFDKHIASIKAGNVNAAESDIMRAGWAGSHGEIRALDALLKKVDPAGKLGDAVFNDVTGYNRFLRAGAKEIQPPCVHCYYITTGVKFIGF